MVSSTFYLAVGYSFNTKSFRVRRGPLTVEREFGTATCYSSSRDVDSGAVLNDFYDERAVWVRRARLAAVHTSRNTV